MSDETPQQPIEQLRAALESDAPEAVDECLDVLTPEESTHAIAHLSPEEQAKLMQVVPEKLAADLMEALPETQAAEILHELKPDAAASIVNQLESDEQADLIGRLSEADAEAVLEQMRPEDASNARRLLEYPRDSAGGLMVTEFLAYVDNLRVEDVVADLRQHAEKYRQLEVQYAYVVTPEGNLTGVLRLRDLLLASPDERIERYMISHPQSMQVDAKLEELERFFDRHAWFGVPIVDEEGKMVGVVRRGDVEQAAEERASRSFLKFMGIMGGEELRTMPVRKRSLRRLSWLSINIVLNIIAASVIALHQETLEAVIALAVFLPIISDMSGCSGNQAVAVSMRELALGVVRPGEVWRVLLKESAVGIINGVVLGLLLGTVAMLWKGNLMLGVVVAAALALNTIVAVIIGGTVPLVLRGMGHDPALASGPILTTVTDMCGFFLVLTFASLALPLLVT